MEQLLLVLGRAERLPRWIRFSNFGMVDSLFKNLTAMGPCVKSNAGQE